MTKPKILVADPLPDGILAKLKQMADVDVAYKLSKEALIERIKPYEGLVVRSETKVLREIIESAPRLKVVARAGVGVDNIDVEAATQKGIVVLNSPEGNTLAAAEHTMAMMLTLARKIPQAHASIKKGEWNRSQFIGTELYGKTLGIIGLGRIGREVALRASSFKMHLLGYDPFINETYAAESGVKLVDLPTLLKDSDFITLHLPLKPETENILNAEKLALVKAGSFIINCARGGLVDEKALYEVLKEKRIGGAALDVFAKEPPKESPLLSLENVVLTPHLGASTEEAQQRVAQDVVEQILDVLQGNPARSPVNLPALTPEKLQFLKPYLFLLEKMGLFVSQLFLVPFEKIHFLYQGEISKEDTTVLTSAALKGILQHELGESVNYVNAPILAKQRGIQVEESRSASSITYTSQLSIQVKSKQKKFHVTGTVFENGEARIVELEGYPLNIVPQGCKLLTWHLDKPGMVGRVGTCLGNHDINIAEMQLGRDKVRDRAVMVLSVDDLISQKVLNELKALDGIEDARVVVL